MLAAHAKDAHPIVPLKSDAVSKDQVQGNGDSDFKAPDAKVVPQVFRKSKSSSKKILGPENKSTEEEMVEGDLMKDQEKSSDHNKSGKEAGEVKKGKESGEAKKSKTIDFIAGYEVELGIEVGRYYLYLILYTLVHIIVNLNPFPGNCGAGAY